MSDDNAAPNDGSMNDDDLRRSTRDRGKSHLALLAEANRKAAEENDEFSGSDEDETEDEEEEGYEDKPRTRSRAKNKDGGNDGPVAEEGSPPAGPRRSGRERKQVESVYDEAAAAVVEKEQLKRGGHQNSSRGSAEGGGNRRGRARAPPTAGSDYGEVPKEYLAMLVEPPTKSWTVEPTRKDGMPVTQSGNETVPWNMAKVANVLMEKMGMSKVGFYNMVMPDKKAKKAPPNFRCFLNFHNDMITSGEHKLNTGDFTFDPISAYTPSSWYKPFVKLAAKEIKKLPSADQNAIMKYWKLDVRCQVSLYGDQTDCVIQSIQQDVQPNFGSRRFVYGPLSDEDINICKLGRKLVKKGMAKIEGNQTTTIINFLSPLLHRDPKLLRMALSSAEFAFEPMKPHKQDANKSNSPEAAEYHQELQKALDIYAMKVGLTREQTFSGRTTHTHKGTGEQIGGETRAKKSTANQLTLTNSLQQIRASLEIDKLEELEYSEDTKVGWGDKYPVFLVLAGLFSLGVIHESLEKQGLKPLAALLLNCDESVIAAMSTKNSVRKYNKHSLGHADFSLFEKYKHKPKKVGSESHNDLKAKLKQEIENLLTRRKEKEQLSNKREAKDGSEGRRRSKRKTGSGGR